MIKTAEVVINSGIRNLTGAFTYFIPDSFSYLDTGWRVIVPFGSRQEEGFVVAVGSEPEGRKDELKSIQDVLDDEPWFDDHMMQTARWLSARYLCAPAEAMRLFIPGKKGIRKEKIYYLNENQAGIANKTGTETQAAVLEWFRRQKIVTMRQFQKEFGPEARSVIEELKQRKLVLCSSTVQTARVNKYESELHLALTAQQAAELLPQLQRKPAQLRLIQALLAGNLTDSDLKTMRVSRQTVKTLVDLGMIKIVRKQVMRDSYQAVAGKNRQVTLSPEQATAVAAIAGALSHGRFQSFLLHGITGSGKTEVYIRAVAAVRQAGKQAIVLVPEIALTSQLVQRFKARFANDVAVIHSKLSLNERYDTWQRIREETAGVIIGARSAVFAPAPNLGIIILDEEHEFTYKQEESPYYHTREVALIRAQLAQAAVVLGSATPAVETFYDALNGRHVLLSLPSRIAGAALPQVTLVDMREELKKGRRSVLSTQLEGLLRDTIQRGEQAIVLLNRRGHSTFVLCRECGHVITCRHCAVALTYHYAAGMMRCHYCDSAEPVPTLCPACQSRYIKFFGTGTQKVEQELQQLFPGCRIVRMDQDTTHGKLAQDAILSDFGAGKYDILLGTQMVAKGHDLQNVTAVGILSVDTILNIPDFRGAERTFALITQAAGRAGRGDKPGRVVVQAYNPEHYAVRAAADQDYASFYAAEIEFRQKLFYPPFCQLIKCTVAADMEDTARRKAEQLAAALKSELGPDTATEIIGPFPAPILKVKDRYRMIILIKAGNLDTVKEIVRRKNWHALPDTVFDVSPISLV